MQLMDHRQFAPATQRNREPILAQLLRWLPDTGTVLELGSGSGEHAVYFSPRLPAGLQWQPSDQSVDCLASIDAWVRYSGITRVLPARRLDIANRDWGLRAQALIAINVLHYSPAETTTALFRGASAVLDAGAPVILYGPYMRDGRHTAPSNAEFDRWLKSRDPAFGVRDLSMVGSEAERYGFRLLALEEMPANNLLLVYRTEHSNAGSDAGHS